MSRRLLLGLSIGCVPLAFLFDGVTVLVLPVRFADAGSDATLIGLASFAGFAAGSSCSRWSVG
jgi:hypothetical protein